MGGVISRLVAPFPLDVASDAGSLAGGRGLVRQRGVHRGAQVAAGDRLAVARPAVVELSAIDQPTLFVEKKKIRRAGGRIFFCRLLRFVVKERESKAFLPREGGQALRRVIRVAGGVVRADRDE